MAAQKDGIKTRLDEMWKELQSNLPSVSFDSGDEEGKDNEEDGFVVVGGGQEVEEDDEEKLARFLDAEQASASADGLDERDGLSPSAVLIRDEDLAGETRALRLSELARSSHVSAEAAKITRGIFETTSSKLSMEIFDTINIDKLLETVKDREHPSSGAGLDEIEAAAAAAATSSSSPRFHGEDEKVLKKLAELSQAQSGRPSSQRPSTNAELEDIDRRITADLNRFLRQHNVRDGNLVETRRLDLRASQEPSAKPAPFRHVYTKPTIESLLRDIVFKEDDAELFRAASNGGGGQGGKMRFLNEPAEESSSDESDDEDEASARGLWIERFRAQKSKTS